MRHALGYSESMKLKEVGPSIVAKVFTDEIAGFLKTEIRDVKFDFSDIKALPKR
jgi:hypothetical protein